MEQETKRESRKSFKIKILLIILLLLIAGTIFYQYWWVPKEREKFVLKTHSCTQDSDCEIADFSCCPDLNPCGSKNLDSVNKNYKIQLEIYLKSKCKEKCLPPAPPACTECLKLEKTTPVCTNNQCSIKKELNCEDYCKAVVKDESKTCPLISDESLITKESTEECKCISELNIIERTDFTKKRNLSSDVSSYQDFIKNNKQYSNPISEEELEKQIEEAKEYLANHPEGKIAENLREKIIQELNIGFLLEGLNQRKLIVTTIAKNQYEDYIEKELLFEDPKVGIFSVLLLIPKGQGPWPAIVGLHGHGDSKEVFKEGYFGEDLAKEGFVVIMPSFRAMDCDEVERDISKELLFKGFTLMGMRVYETHLLIKYLKSKDFVDKNKIGIIGHSGGSHTASVVSRVSEDLKAGVYDYDSFMLDLCIEENPDVHCQTVPSLAYYDPQINNRSTLGFPFRKFEYKYPGSNDKQEVISFFKNNLK